MIGDPDIGAIRRRKSMGGRIAQLRRQAGLTQAGLSQLSDLTPSDLNDLEHGLVHVSSPVLFSLCRALKVEIIAVFHSYDDHVCMTYQSADDRPPSSGPH